MEEELACNFRALSFKLQDKNQRLFRSWMDCIKRLFIARETNRTYTNIDQKVNGIDADGQKYTTVYVRFTHGHGKEYLIRY